MSNGKFTMASSLSFITGHGKFTIAHLEKFVKWPKLPLKEKTLLFDKVKTNFVKMINRIVLFNLFDINKEIIVVNWRRFYNEGNIVWITLLIFILIFCDFHHSWTTGPYHRLYKLSGPLEKRKLRKPNIHSICEIVPSLSMSIASNTVWKGKINQKTFLMLVVRIK